MKKQPLKKYIVTVVFESRDEYAAFLAFQNAACLINKATGTEPIQIAHIKEVLNGDMERPTLETKQVLNPEDFSTWREGKDGGLSGYEKQQQPTAAEAREFLERTTTKANKAAWKLIRGLSDVAIIKLAVLRGIQRSKS